MSSNYNPAKGDTIKYNLGKDLIQDNTSAKGFIRDTPYHHYVTAISFRVNIWAQYFFFGSEHLKIQVYRYSISQNKWVLVKEHADLYGGLDAVSNGSWGKISVNCATATTDGDFNWSLESTDSIHWDIVITRFKGVKGDHNSRAHLVLGDINTLPEAIYNSTYKNKRIFGKLPSNNYLWHVQGVQVKNPFNEPWGNITSSRGSKILAGEHFKLLTQEFIKRK